MVNLYWKTKDDCKDVEQQFFVNESEFEKYILTNQQILGGDISIINRQVRTGSKEGIPDMLAVDQDSRICIIEIKNDEANEDILPQALQYAIWAETNPDSIKALWLENKNKPEGIEIDWDNFDIRIILIAPSFKQNVSRMAKKINYPIELIQIKRYVLGENEFVEVERIEENIARVGSTKATEEWSWEYYEKEHGKEATETFRSIVKSIEKYAEDKKMNLPFNINKNYTGFKNGTRVVFAVAWGGTYECKIKIKVSEKIAKGHNGANWEFQRYDSTFKESIFRLKNIKNTEVNELDELFKVAYEGKLKT